MKSLRYILPLVSSLLAFLASARTPMLENALDTLDNVLSEQPAVLAGRYRAVDSLKSLLSADRQSSACLMKIGEAYHGLDNDSSIHYYYMALSQARHDGDVAHTRRLLPLLSERLAKASRFYSAYTTLDTIALERWSVPEKILYYSMLGHVCLDAASFNSSKYQREELTARAVACLDSLISYLPEGEGLALTKAQRHFLKEEPTMALGELKEVFEEGNPFSPEYAIMANMLASYYKDKPEHVEEYIYYLVLSAISDARRANGEAVSLAKLSKELAERGDTDRAFNYIITAAELINDSRSILYNTEIAPELLYFAKLWSERKTTADHVYVFIIVLLTIVIVLLCAAIYRQHRKNRQELERLRQLSASIISRDHYINQLINLCGVYVDGLEEFNRLVGRKLKVNQIQDLYKTIESGKMLQDQTEHFFEVFDDAVMKIFPNFIGEINSLLLPDRQVTAPSAGRLTPELRIVAFMRLGVTDSARLAKFLGLSVNTIYTYRNRMKSRAKNRESFEEDILNLEKIIV